MVQAGSDSSGVQQGSAEEAVVDMRGRAGGRGAAGGRSGSVAQSRRAIQSTMKMAAAWTAPVPSTTRCASTDVRGSGRPETRPARCASPRARAGASANGIASSREQTPRGKGGGSPAKCSQCAAVGEQSMPRGSGSTAPRMMAAAGRVQGRHNTHQRSTPCSPAHPPKPSSRRDTLTSRCIHRRGKSPSRPPSSVRLWRSRRRQQPYRQQHTWQWRRHSDRGGKPACSEETKQRRQQGPTSGDRQTALSISQAAMTSGKH